MHPVIAHDLVLQRSAELRREADAERLGRLARRSLARRSVARRAWLAGVRFAPAGPPAERRTAAAEDATC